MVVFGFTDVKRPIDSLLKFDMTAVTATNVIITEFQSRKIMTHGNRSPRRGDGRGNTDSDTAAENRLGSLPGGDRVYYYYTTRPKDTQYDMDKIVNTLEMLRTSCWYHGAMSSREARKKLTSSPTGTFLIRDSQDPRHLFSLSVKTPRGTTSVRIEYTHKGKFRLDSDQSVREKAPTFDCVVKLVAFYMMNGERTQTNIGKQLFWLEPSGRKDVPVKLSIPLKGDVPTLQHICRLTINRTLPRYMSDQLRVLNLPLPTRLKNFLVEYPYVQ